MSRAAGKVITLAIARSRISFSLSKNASSVRSASNFSFLALRRFFFPPAFAGVVAMALFNSPRSPGDIAVPVGAPLCETQFLALPH